MKNKRESLRDKEYRESYAESFLDAYIATQIRVLREQREMTQVDLAEATNMKQSRISALENVDYSSWTLSTLKRLARAFDLRLNVSFETFGSMLFESDVMSRATLERASFADDPAFDGAVAEVVMDSAYEDGEQRDNGSNAENTSWSGSKVIDAQERFGWTTGLADVA